MLLCNNIHKEDMFKWIFIFMKIKINVDIFEKKLNMKFQMFHLDKISIKHWISNLTFVYNLNMFQIKLTSLCIKEKKSFLVKGLVSNFGQSSNPTIDMYMVNVHMLIIYKFNIIL
jgi:hypothetical protein